MSAGFVVALIAGIVGTFGVRALSRKIGFVNHPNPIVPQHTEPVAYGGGVGVFLACVVGLLVVDFPDGSHLLVPGLLAVGVGLLDDAKRLSVRPKLLLQAGIAAAVVWTGPVPALTPYWGLNLAAASFVVLVLMNAVNLTDVCDGLVAGLSVIALSSLALLTESAVLGIAAFANLGFLVWNRPPASIFLGDAGSHLVGVLLAAGTLQLVEARGVIAGGAQATLAAGVFLFELVFLSFVRVRKGIAPWRGSPDHFSLRMQAGPFSRWQTVLMSWTAGAVLGAAALGTGMGPLWTAPLTACVAGALGLLATRFLLRWEVHG